jgi:hypothetical protein
VLAVYVRVNVRTVLAPRTTLTVTVVLPLIEYGTAHTKYGPDAAPVDQNTFSGPVPVVSSRSSVPPHAVRFE